MSKDTGAGKGDAPRNCFSKQFKDNFDIIDWSKDKVKHKKETYEYISGICEGASEPE